MGNFNDPSLTPTNLKITRKTILAAPLKWSEESDLRMQKLNEDFARLKENKRAWKEELRERSILDKTSGDGLGSD